jgi:hypothetical protein
LNELAIGRERLAIGEDCWRFALGERGPCEEVLQGLGGVVVGGLRAKLLRGCVWEIDADDVGGVLGEEACFASGVEHVVRRSDQGRGIAATAEELDGTKGINVGHDGVSLVGRNRSPSDTVS